MSAGSRQRRWPDCKSIPANVPSARPITASLPDTAGRVRATPTSCDQRPLPSVVRYAKRLVPLAINSTPGCVAGPSVLPSSTTDQRRAPLASSIAVKRPPVTPKMRPSSTTGLSSEPVAAVHFTCPSSTAWARMGVLGPETIRLDEVSTSVSGSSVSMGLVQATAYGGAAGFATAGDDGVCVGGAAIGVGVGACVGDCAVAGVAGACVGGGALAGGAGTCCPANAPVNVRWGSERTNTAAKPQHLVVRAE